MCIKFTTGEFIKKSIKIHGNKYDYSKVNYIDSLTKVDIICKKHGVFKQKPNKHFKNSGGCPKCKLNKCELFIKKSIKIHRNKYGYSLVKYINAKTKIKIICPKHGIFEQKPII